VSFAFEVKVLVADYEADGLLIPIERNTRPGPKGTLHIEVSGADR